MERDVKQSIRERAFEIWESEVPCIELMNDR